VSIPLWQGDPGSPMTSTSSALVGPPQRIGPELLVVRGLDVSFRTARGLVRAVQGLDLDVRAGERVAIVGESGSGKSVTSRAILGLHPPNCEITGSVRLGGRELVGMPKRELGQVRGKEIGLVLQNPATALDPLKTVGWQVAEPLRRQLGLSRAEAHRRALDLLRQVRINDPEQRMTQYPHELSGGISQRVAIAAVIGSRPSLVIADEPTSALDSTTAWGILTLLHELSEQFGIALLMISHDLSIVSTFAETVSVMYSGRVVETAQVARVFVHPKHPYTRGLLDSVPGQSNSRPIPGAIPDPLDRPEGCVFAPRCAHAIHACTEAVPQLRDYGGTTSHLAACDRLPGLDVSAARDVAGPGSRPVAPPHLDDARPILVAHSLHKAFSMRQPGSARRRSVSVVEDVNLMVRPGEVLALVGESGSGKTTVARMVLGLETPTAGDVALSEEASADGALSRRRVQVVFQNPDSSLDPRMTVARIISEPLDIGNVGRQADRRARVLALLAEVGLSERHASMLPHELSGGQRQRVAIARALAGRPELLVLDEPVTGLDVSVQSQVLQLLDELRRREDVSYLFISHDLAVVRQIAHRVMVMYMGRIVETSPVEEFFANPQHPYSAALIEAASLPEARGEGLDRVADIGPPNSLFDLPSGCRFHPRCSRRDELCVQSSPALAVYRSGQVACHFPLSQNAGRRSDDRRDAAGAE
jgi:oligopeptide/dipeptide ABC transporter ATP-binding protein